MAKRPDPSKALFDGLVDIHVEMVTAPRNASLPTGPPTRLHVLGMQLLMLIESNHAMSGPLSALEKMRVSAQGVSCNS